MGMKAIIIIDHGSRYPAANDALLDVVQLMRDSCPDCMVEAAHMELAEPTIEQAINTCVNQGATTIIAHPYMLSPGRHAIRDIPNMVMEISADYPEIVFEVTEPLGLDQQIVNVIKKRCHV